MARSSIYLNFPGNAEEAFLFYKKVFGTDFTPPGIVRFNSVPAAEDQPPMPEETSNMVLHVELPITGGTMLMATDAPGNMGFAVAGGNQMHINLEPDSREEADHLFKELSDGGKVTMPMQDMFWGAYYGSFTCRFGINWMVNYATK